MDPRSDLHPQTHPNTKRLLRRSRSDSVVCGVCGGLGRYLGVDPTLVRVALALLVLFGGTGVLAYIIAIFVIPRERHGEDLGPPAKPLEINLPLAVGVAALIVGLIALSDEPFGWFPSTIVPVALVGLGIYVLIKRDRG